MAGNPGYYQKKKKDADTAASAVKPPPEKPTPKTKMATNPNHARGLAAVSGGAAPKKTSGMQTLKSRAKAVMGSKSNPTHARGSAGHAMGDSGKPPPPARYTASTKTKKVEPPPQVSHKITKGETLTSIAKRYGTTVAELAKKNNIKNPDLIYAGATIKL
jgi:LysM repeat protein